MNASFDNIIISPWKIRMTLYHNIPINYKRSKSNKVTHAKQHGFSLFPQPALGGRLIIWPGIKRFGFVT